MARKAQVAVLQRGVTDSQYASKTLTLRKKQTKRNRIAYLGLQNGKLCATRHLGMDESHNVNLGGLMTALTGAIAASGAK